MRVLASGIDTDLNFSTAGEDRKEGLHLSDILSRMAWEKDRKYNPDAPKDYMLFEQGHTWETIVARALGERHKDRAGYRPEQFQEDGIWMSPDWLAPKRDVQHEEWKATKKSLKAIDEKVAEWAAQSMCYVRALLRRKLIKRPVTRFRIWFVMGDWSFESKGDLSLLRDYYKHDVEWSLRELDEKWSAVISFARRTGLLKEDKSWQSQPDRPRLNRTIAAREAKKAASGAPQRSRAKARVVTFQSTRKSSRSSVA